MSGKKFFDVYDEIDEILNETNKKRNKMPVYTVNLFFIISIPIALFLGFTGRVDWWTILLISLLNINITFQLKRKRK